MHICKVYFSANFIFFCLQYPEIVEPLAAIANIASETNADVTDNVNSYAELLGPTEIGSIATLLSVECADETKGFVQFPKECAPLPNDCKDLLNRLLDYEPQNRIRSLFKLQRIAFYMNYNFADVKRKKVFNQCRSQIYFFVYLNWFFFIMCVCFLSLPL